ncbi:hypothetical protein PoB_000087500 [Plakobranchus ocellatus]|uniref:Uncharacterized protein n=1 Tax=Plakobranchus ocellatus TaxID=259542 RepID=A0AAV3XUP8_9GAST|nr:hypothetical protein PoB_000087500 [Plakobranchus ocellatus]
MRIGKQGMEYIIVVPGEREAPRTIEPVNKDRNFYYPGMRIAVISGSGAPKLFSDRDVYGAGRSWTHDRTIPTHLAAVSLASVPPKASTGG